MSDHTPLLPAETVGERPKHYRGVKGKGKVEVSAKLEGNALSDSSSSDKGANICHKPKRRCQQLIPSSSKEDEKEVVEKAPAKYNRELYRRIRQCTVPGCRVGPQVKLSHHLSYGHPHLTPARRAFYLKSAPVVGRNTTSCKMSRLSARNPLRAGFTSILDCTREKVNEV